MGRLLAKSPYVVWFFTAICCAASHGLAAAPPERLEPRPERTPAERAAQLAEVRGWYETDPVNWPAPTLDEGVEHRELGSVERPAPLIGEAKRRAELGKKLFFDPRLSGSGQIACASCHDPDLGWADGRTVSFGHNRRRLTRNAPSILNSGARASLFWDGRAESLEAQADAVLNNADEMHSGDEVLVNNLKSIPEYTEAFRELDGEEAISIEAVASAIAAFERTVVSGRTRFDRFVDGRYGAMTDEEISGLHLFRTDARCLNCHNGPLLTDDKFHAIGVSMFGRPGEDLGRYNVTGAAEDVGAFRTPSLRDVTRTAPYMHSGLFDLDEALILYNSGMPRERTAGRNDRSTPPPQKSPLVKPLGLNDQDLSDIAAFLGALEESNRRVLPPELPVGL